MRAREWTHGAWRALTVLAAVAVLALLATGGGRRGVAGQGEGEATPEAEAGRTSYAQVIAQGLAAFDPGVVYVWRVREVSPPLEEEAGPGETLAYSFLWQRAGTTIVRSEDTLRRVRLELGEAFYQSLGLVFTRFRIGDTPSRAWIIEIVPADSDPTQLEGEVVFTSQEMNTVPAGTWDLELVRNVLGPGEAAVVAGHTGPALVLPTFGTIEAFSAAGEPTTLEVGAGQLSVGSLALRNPGDEPASYLVAMIGDRVLEPGETPEPETTGAAPDGTPAATAAPPADADTDGDGVTDADETAAGTAADNPDSDDDGVLDGEEAGFGCDPLSADTDEDQLPDGDEVDFETDCQVIDSDGDGYVDGEEVFSHSTDPNDPESFPQ